MSTIRRFLVASSLARLITRERSAKRIVEGHFPASDGRLSYVHFADNLCHLVLVTKPSSEPEQEERTEVPANQGEFLMQVCAGSLAYQRSSFEVAGRVVHLNSFEIPEGLHLIEVEFGEADQAREFEPAAWFGPEVTGEAGYDHNAIATMGRPHQPPVAVSDGAVHAVLDFLEAAEFGQEPVQEEEALVEADGATGMMTEEPAEATVEEGWTTGRAQEEQATGIVRRFPERPHRDLATALSRRREQLSAAEGDRS
jgi:CYTH domain-containing protein